MAKLRYMCRFKDAPYGIDVWGYNYQDAAEKFIRERGVKAPSEAVVEVHFEASGKSKFFEVKRELFSVKEIPRA